MCDFRRDIFIHATSSIFFLFFRTWKRKSKLDAKSGLMSFVTSLLSAGFTARILMFTLKSHLLLLLLPLVFIASFGLFYEQKNKKITSPKKYFWFCLSITFAKRASFLRVSQNDSRQYNTRLAVFTHVGWCGVGVCADRHMQCVTWITLSHNMAINHHHFQWLGMRLCVSLRMNPRTHWQCHRRDVMTHLFRSTTHIFQMKGYFVREAYFLLWK